MATAAAVENIVAVDEIHVSGNVRALNVDHVHALAGSIGLQGDARAGRRSTG